MGKKEFRILRNEELDTQVQTLKEYYGVKSNAGAIKKAIKDCTTVAEHTKIETDKRIKYSNDSIQEEIGIFNTIQSQYKDKGSFDIYVMGKEEDDYKRLQLLKENVFHGYKEGTFTVDFMKDETIKIMYIPF